MLALFLDHPPLFVAGEIVLGLSLALFVGALIAAVIRGVPGVSRLREPGHPNPTIVRRSVGEAVHGHPDVSRAALATTPLVRSRPRCANKASSVEPTRSRQRAVSLRKFPDKPSTSREPISRSLFARSGGGSRCGLENARESLIGTGSSHSELSKGV